MSATRSTRLPTNAPAPSPKSYQRGSIAIPSGPGWTGGATDTVATSVTDDLNVGASADDPMADSADDLALFPIDDMPQQWHTITLELSTDEHDRLVQRARAEGISPEDLLRGLI